MGHIAAEMMHDHGQDGDASQAIERREESSRRCGPPQASPQRSSVESAGCVGDFGWHNQRKVHRTAHGSGLRVGVSIAEVARLQTCARNLNSGEFSYQYFHSLSLGTAWDRNGSNANI